MKFIEPLRDHTLSAIRFFIPDFDLEHKPNKVYIGLAGRCIMNCSFCDVNPVSKKLNFPTGLADTSMVKDFISQNLEVNPRCHFQFSVWGDPLQHPDIAKFIRFIKKKSTDSKTTIKTNGELLTRELSAELVDSGLDLMGFSVDSLDQEVFGINRKKGVLDLIIGNIVTFGELRKSVLNPPRTRLQSIRKYLFENPASISRIHDLKGAIDEVALSPLGLQTLIGSELYESKEKADRKEIDVEYVYPTCSALDSHLILYPHGTIQGCCGAPREIVWKTHDLHWGEFPEKSVKELFCSDQAWKMRNKLRTRKYNSIPESCKYCTELKQKPMIELISYDTFIEKYLS